MTRGGWLLVVGLPLLIGAQLRTALADGACCTVYGTCVETSQADCETYAQGRFLGEGVPCFLDPCGPISRDRIITNAVYSEVWDWRIDPGNEDTALYDERYNNDDPSCCYTSPLINSLNAYWGGVFAQQTGVPYAFGRRLHILEERQWLDGNGDLPLGQSYCQFAWRAAQGLLPFTFAGAADAVGLAGRATEYGYWETAAASTLESEPERSGDSSWYVKLCHWGSCDGEYGMYEPPDAGDVIVVSEGESDNAPYGHAMIVEELLESAYERPIVSVCDSDPRWLRCHGAFEWHDTYMALLQDGYSGICVRSLYGNPATSFWRVATSGAGANAWVEWDVLYLRDTWGFAVQWRESEQTEWTQVGDYVVSEEHTTNKPRSFQWSGPLSPGFVRVLEIGETGRITESEATRVAG